MDARNERTAGRSRLLDLHARVLQGDLRAFDELFRRVSVPLRRALRRAFPHAPDGEVADAVHDALRAYGERPALFDSDRGALDHFVYGIARHILRDRLRAAGRRSALEHRWAQSRHDAYGDHAGHDGMDRVLAQELRLALPLVCSPAELAAMKAYLDGDTDAAATQLRVTQRSPADRVRAVQRLAMRVVERLRRLFGAGREGRGQSPNSPGAEKKVNG